MGLTRGRLSVGGSASHIVETWELVREDLSILLEKRPNEFRISKLRASHHNVARLLATGQFTNRHIARITGYTPSRISLFLKDPSFKELVSRYREQVEEAFQKSEEEFTNLLYENMVRAERMISDRLDQADENEELLPIKELLAVSRDAGDRLGYGKKQTNLNVNVDFAAKLEAAIVRSGKGMILDHAPPPTSVRVGAENAKGGSGTPQPVVAAPALPSPPRPASKVPPEPVTSRVGNLPPTQPANFLRRI